MIPTTATRPVRALRTALAAALAAGALIVAAPLAGAATGAVAHQADPSLQLPPPDSVPNPAPSNPGPSNPEPSTPAPSNPGPSNPGPSNPTEPEAEEPAGPTPQELEEQQAREEAERQARLERIREREAKKRSDAVARFADRTGARATGAAAAVIDATAETASQASVDLERLEKTREGGNLIDPRIVALGAAAVLLIGIGGVTSGRRRTGGGSGLPWRGVSLPSLDGIRDAREARAAARGPRTSRMPIPTAVERFVTDKIGEIVVAIAAIVIITLALYLIANPGFLFS